MQTLPERTAFIGRIRKDAKLFALPEQSTGRGRRRLYGSAFPTPEAINTLRVQLWGRALGVRNFGDFIKGRQVLAKCEKPIRDPKLQAR
ncbi:MAG: hypothetical protein Q8P22_10420 [Chloroflexota bacterium]|nr:hypothetical protein [Chloroflexota bacterium]